MDWARFLDALKSHPVATLTCAGAILMAGVSVGGWFWHANDCHSKGVVAYESVAELKQMRREAQLVKDAQSAYLVQLCEAGELPDSPVTCAKARAASDVLGDGR